MNCKNPNCTEEVEQLTTGRRKVYCSDACKQEMYRNRKQTIRNKKLKEQRSKLYVVQLTLDVANRFVSLHHRHNNPVPLHRFSLGAIDETGLLRGVAIVNNPIVPQLMDGQTLEVLRIATDGCSNACSFLYAAARTATFALGYRKLITYTLQSESGASLRGAGWEKVKEVDAHKGWAHRPGRKKLEIYNSAKWRWETINPVFRDKQRPTKIILPFVDQPKNDGHIQLSLTVEEV